jgi:hypothetical protein
MPPQTHAYQPPQAQPGSDIEAGVGQPASSVSRRSLLRGAAGVGAVGLAAAAGGGAVFAATRPAGPGPADAGKAAAAPAPPQNPGGEPLVVYLRDTATGEFEVFNGTSQVRIHNPRLVAQLLDGLQTAQ